MPSSAEYFRARREMRLREGLCVQCGQDDHEPDRTRCVTCAEDAADRAAKRRAYAASQGLCDACIRRKAARGRGGRCKHCADRYLHRQLKRDRLTGRRRKAA